MVAQLRTTFLKLAAAMEGAMVRLGEAGSKELYPVSQYYSSTLVTYIRTVLQVGKVNWNITSTFIWTNFILATSAKLVLGDPCNHVLPSGASDANAGKVERASNKVFKNSIFAF